jgi:cell cycle arrest protein BUB3
MTNQSLLPEIPEAKSLANPPTDGITSLLYLPHATSSVLGATSWDGSLYVYDTAAATTAGSPPLQVKHAMDSGPLLSLATPGDRSFVTGGLDGSIRRFDITTSTTEFIGQHPTSSTSTNTTSGCNCLSSLRSMNLIVSAGWHSKLHLWDIRQQDSQPVATVPLPGKAFAMDVDESNSRIMVGTSGRRTVFIDVRMTASTGATAEIVLDRESSLKFQTRTVKFFPDGTGIAVGSVEARVAIEYLDELDMVPPKGSSKYAFKCHRVQDRVYPVNAIEFHPRFGTFATGGCDGNVGASVPENSVDCDTCSKLFGCRVFPLSFSYLYHLSLSCSSPLGRSTQTQASKPAAVPHVDCCFGLSPFGQ